jgi:hypothetical protein
VSPEEHEFLTLYGYGQGGVWTLIVASSSDEIAAKYPELTVVNEPPGTMARAELDRIRKPTACSRR